MVIVYKLTTRNRPAKMLIAYDSVVANSATDQYKFIVSIDSDDTVTLKSEELKALQLDAKVTICIGESKSKVEAINRDMPKSGWDILVNLSDDQEFTQYGFDEVIREHCGLDTFLHLPDGHVNELLPTMSIMGNEYYNRFGYIYHPDYVSLWCDNEAMDVAIELNRHVYLNQHLFEHKHPAWGFGQTDSLGRRNDIYYRQDERTYIKRKNLGFPKLSIFEK